MAGAASALEVSTDASKLSATTVSYGGTKFTLWQGYYTATLTENGAPVSGWEVRGTALGEQVTSIETTNSSGKAVLPVVTDVQPSLIHVEVRSSPSAVWEEPGPPPIVEPAPPAATAAAEVATVGREGGGAAAGGAERPVPRAGPAILGAPRGGLSPGGGFNVVPFSGDWAAPPALEAAAPPAAGATGAIGLAEALLIDIAMVSAAVGAGLRLRRPR